MGTAAFDALWGDEKPAKSSARPQSFDAMWEAAGPTYRTGHSKFTPTQLQARADRAVAQSQDEAGTIMQAADDAATALATHALNVAQGIPGVEAVEAGAGALGSSFTDHPMGYRESLQTLQGRTGQIGGVTRGIEHIVGAAAALPALAYQGPLATAAAGPTLQAARYGVLSGLLQADPNRGAVARLHDAALEGGAGAALGATAAGGMAGLGALRMLANAPGKAQALASLLRLVSGHGLSGRLASGVLEELTPAAAPVATSVESAAATVPPLPTESAIQTMLRLVPDTPAPATIAPAVERPAAQSVLAQMLESNHPFVTPEEFVKGYPISGDPPPASAETLRRLEDALRQMKGVGLSAGIGLVPESEGQDPSKHDPKKKKDDETTVPGLFLKRVRPDRPSHPDSVDVGLFGDTDSPKERAALWHRIVALTKNVRQYGIAGLDSAGPGNPYSLRRKKP